jgi:hypothetical protein
VSYVDAGYTVVLATLAVYAGWVMRRRRILTRALPAKAGGPEDQ